MQIDKRLAARLIGNGIAGFVTGYAVGLFISPTAAAPIGAGFIGGLLQAGIMVAGELTKYGNFVEPSRIKKAANKVATSMLVF